MVKKWLYFYYFEVPHDGFELIYDTKNPKEVLGTAWEKVT